MTVCTAIKQTGEPCTAKARAGTDPPRCGRHPSSEVDKTGHEKRQAFLEAYALVGNVSDAASHAGVSRQIHYQWLDDPEYADAFHHAREQAADRLEREAVRRATAGVEKAVWYKGEQVGVERQYSDVLLIFLLKGMRPEKFRDNYGAQDVAIVRTPWDPEQVVAEAKPRADALRVIQGTG
jgi:hypothetical protein